MEINLSNIKEILKYNFLTTEGYPLKYKYLTHKEQEIMDTNEFEEIILFIKTDYDPLKELIEALKTDNLIELPSYYKNLLNQIKI